MNKKIAAVLLLGFYGQQVDASQLNMSQSLDVASSAQETIVASRQSSSGPRSDNPLHLATLNAQVKVNQFMECSDVARIQWPTKNGKKIKQERSENTVAQNLSRTFTLASKERIACNQKIEQNLSAFLEKKSTEVTTEEPIKLKNDRRSLNRRSLKKKQEATFLVAVPLIAGVVCTACPPLVVPCMATAALEDTFLTTQKIHTKAGSFWSNVGHSMFSLRIFTPILAYAGMMYGAPEKTSEAFKQVAGPVLAGLTTAIVVENVMQSERFNKKDGSNQVRLIAACCKMSSEQKKLSAWKAENSTWANDETLKKYNALRHRSIAGFIYGPKPEL